MAWASKQSRKEFPAAFGRVTRWCKRCDRRRQFWVRQKKDGSRQIDCVSCSRRRGQARTPTYVTWLCMKQRCLNQNAWNYPYYGGKGVTIYQPWIDSYEAFLADVGERPPGKTLDRSNSAGNYEPGNVGWASHRQQVANRFVSYCIRKTRKLVEG